MEKYNTEKEVWKDIFGYEGYYQISNLGRVKSHGRYVKGAYGKYWKEGRILKHGKTTNGYDFVYLSVNNNKKNVMVHRIVAETFIPNPEKKETVNHINGNKKDNRVSNLEWNTYKENNHHAIKTGLVKNRFNHKGSRPVGQYSENGVLINTYPSLREASRKTGIRHDAIRGNINHGWKAGGYKWDYMN